MKKKLLSVVLVLCLALSFVGCSLGEVKPDTETAKVIEDEAVDKVTETVTEEVTETAEDVLKETASAEPSATPEEVKEVSVVLESDSALTYADYIMEQDKSEEYGVNSTSSEDAYQFLNEEGAFILGSLGETENVGNYDYSGRFAYPTIVKNDLFTECLVSYRSDHSMIIDCRGKDGIVTNTISFTLGNDNYEFTKNAPLSDYVPPTEEFGTVNTEEGETTVLSRDSSEKLGFSIYVYKLGAFTVQIQYNNDTMYTPEELQAVVDVIKLQ